MDEPVPFLKPNLPTLDAYAHHIRRMEESRWYSNFGPLNGEFLERIVAELFAGVGHACTVANATLGLALALRVAGRATGRWVLMPSFTFAATPLAAQWAGFEPYFLDVDPQSWSVPHSKMATVLSELGDDVAAVMPYAAFGDPIDLEGYAALHRSGIPVVIDAAASLGSGAPEHFGQGFPGALVFSMHATKAFGIGEGGLVYSGSKALVSDISMSSNFGFGAGRTAEWVGINAKLTEFGAAIALTVLDRFPSVRQTRMDIYAQYVDALNQRGLLARGFSLQRRANPVCAHQFLPLLLPEGMENRALVLGLADRGVECRTYFAPACHQQPIFRSSPSQELQVTNDLTHRILSLPLWDEMSTSTVARIVDAVADVVGVA